MRVFVVFLFLFFFLRGYSLTLFANPEEGGTVIGSGTFNSGDTDNIRAIPNPGWEFISWTDTEGNLISNLPEYRIVIHAKYLKLLANFDITRYNMTLFANPEKGG